MTSHISAMSPATRAIIRAHITKSEEAIEYPYLDLKGHLTIGIGFKVNNKSEFAQLPLSLLKNGKWVSANVQEKKHAFDLMMAEKRKQNGNFNNKVHNYKNITKVQMLRPAQNAKLDGIITTNVRRIVNAVGAKAWNRLNDQQKAAVTDIAHPFGGLRKFPNLKRAIISGNAKNIAAESLFYTDRKTRARDGDRLERNLQALLNINKTAAKAELGKMLRDIDDQQAEDVGAPVSSGKTPPAPSRSNDADAEMIGASLGKEAGGKDETGGDAAHAGGPRDTAAGTPAGPPEQDETAAFTPQQQVLKTALLENDGPEGDVLVKDPSQWTEAEFKLAKRETGRLQPGPERTQWDQAVMAFLDSKYSDNPVQWDATGRMIDPVPITSINKEPMPATAPNGEPLQSEMTRIADVVAKTAGADGARNTVAAIQEGVNMLSADKGKSATPIPNLKIDGALGPRTRQMVKMAAARWGAPKVEEGLALGRFAKVARNLQAGRLSGGVGPHVRKTFGPLFRSANKPTPKTNVEEDGALQATINDLRRDALGQNEYKPVREDGSIGPKTETAFRNVMPAVGAERFTSAFGRNLGFLDGDEDGAFV
jgi:GH24 family phage-related lysozyme (muramidase)